MTIPSTIESLSTTAASNNPTGSAQRTEADDGLRAAYAFIKQSVSAGSNIASATTITPASTGMNFAVTGTTTITTIASTNSWDGRIIWLRFAGILTFTHGANLDLPGDVSITTAAGDIAGLRQTSAGAWQCFHYYRASGTGSVAALLVNSSIASAPKLLVDRIGSSTIPTMTTGTVAAFIGNTASASPAFSTHISGVSAHAGVNFGDVDDDSQGWVRYDNDSGSLKLGAGADDRILVTSDGRLYGSALHNNAGVVTGTTNQYVGSGTYTPTLTDVAANTTTLTAAAFQWVRVGNVVNVSGQFVADADSTGLIQIGISLPIASNLASAGQLAGVGTRQNGSTKEAGTIEADTSNNRAQFECEATNTNDFPVTVSFQYVVL